MIEIIIITTLMNMCCFLVGVITGFKTIKGENVKLPNPIKTVKEFKINREVEKEIQREKIINENIDNYDGTSLGQQDIPR